MIQPTNSSISTLIKSSLPKFDKAILLKYREVKKLKNDSFHKDFNSHNVNQKKKLINLKLFNQC